jgi:ADP-ribose pyrophosphatase YjhB (NUDIX family)
MKHQKVAVIVWTVDPEGIRRFLLRHNKPFDGYEDERTIVFGDIESNESLEDAAKREAKEEYSLEVFEEAANLYYKVEFEGKHGPSEAHFMALKTKDLNSKIVLNEESIGYDWMPIEKVEAVMKHEDEKRAFYLIK